MPSTLIVTQLKRHVAATSLLKDSYHHSSYFVSILHVNNFSVFVINELKFSFHCSSVFCLNMYFISFKHKYGSVSTLLDGNFKRSYLPYIEGVNDRITSLEK